MDIGRLATLRTLASYLPIALYFESLRLHSALIVAIGNKASVPPPVTGCIKDLNRIWNFSRVDLQTDFGSRIGAVVVSLRHGNSFPLANEAIVKRVLRRPWNTPVLNPKSDDELVPRKTDLNITYLLPSTSQEPASCLMIAGPRAAALSELVLLLTLSGICFRSGLEVGGILLLCLAVNLTLLLVLQQSTSFVFANASALRKDILLTAANGAATDAHVILQDWNASEIDVLVGYSSQLHALTNIPVIIKPWGIVAVLVRLLGGVLILQGALLAALLGRETEQTWGSLIWLACYLVMMAVTWLTAWHEQNSRPNNLPVEAVRTVRLQFSGRRAALAFISTLPGVNQILSALLIPSRIYGF
ncbi:uncharacterized protein J7T54_005806 [Emericellopsis cladophorae]|uniref:Uncharacterized protein n=1 Tax=Emericellopsis cladophorae TaxID=2686198 RepID=A0A9P9XUR5_9HYPO|nr:uncharacterized protein J7T54_005806 [Emericellopsis cladophorae]KAI6777794.1 hypothetical protein J7T54_005806 [Emericellopsis cladophorae]